MTSTMTSSLQPSTRDSISLGALPIDRDLLPESGPRWLRSLREESLARFNELGLPTIRHEEWKYTSVRAIQGTSFVSAAPESHAISPADVQRLSILPVAGPLIVFINGRWSAELSNTDGLPAGVTVMPLLDAAQESRGLVERHLNRHVRAAEDAFASLNTALFDDGVFIHVSNNAAAPQPILLLNITTRGAGPLLGNPRNLIVVEEGGSATVVEDYVAADHDGPYLTNAVTEFIVGSGAEAHHYMLEREGRSAFNISTLAIHQGDRSRFSSHTALIGGALVRNNVNPVIDGEHVYSMLNGLYIGQGHQHLDSHMRVEHRKANGGSRQFYKGILGDQSRGVFTGRIIVSQAAQKTDAVQSNQNLLLSNDSQAQTRPQLEIYADDVKCTHGATVGQLNEDAMFYLRSRGMPPEAARALLVYAFAGESLERMEHEGIRAAVRGLLLEALPGSATLADVLSE